jgi:hypothetical protein
MTHVPKDCQPYFDLIEQGQGKSITQLDKLIDCLTKKISDNAGQKRVGKRSDRKAREIVAKLQSGAIKKFNPNLAFPGKSDPFDMTDEEYLKLQEDMLKVNWELLERDEKDVMKAENGLPDMSDGDFFELLKREELGIGAEEGGEVESGAEPE